MNLISVPVTDGGVKFGSHTLEVPRDSLKGVGSNAIVGVRPEDVEVSTDGQGLEITIDVVEELGADAYVYGTPTDESISLEGGEDTIAKPFIARVDGRRVPRKGDKIWVQPNASHMHVFNAESGARLSS
jgi:multiple sugar transport system ATP-binding protein